MRPVFTDEGWEDSASWVDQRKVLLRVHRMVEESKREPGTGIGKPERLSGDLAGYWSRRIDQEHRLVSTVIDGDLVVVQVRYRY